MTLTAKLFEAPQVKGNMNDWQGRHMMAVNSPRGAERPIVRLCLCRPHRLRSRRRDVPK